MTPCSFALPATGQAVLFSQNKPATSNQPTVFFSQNKSAPAISHQPNEQAVRQQIREAKALFGPLNLAHK
jgi:hypothetical protein